jgi:hypothetical protein
MLLGAHGGLRHRNVIRQEIWSFFQSDLRFAFCCSLSMTRMLSGKSGTGSRVSDREVVSQASRECRRCQMATRFCSIPPICMGGAMSVRRSPENSKRRS